MYCNQEWSAHPPESIDSLMPVHAPKFTPIPFYDLLMPTSIWLIHAWWRSAPRFITRNLFKTSLFISLVALAHTPHLENISLRRVICQMSSGQSDEWSDESCCHGERCRVHVLSASYLELLVPNWKCHFNDPLNGNYRETRRNVCFLPFTFSTKLWQPIQPSMYRILLLLRWMPSSDSLNAAFV